MTGRNGKGRKPHQSRFPELPPKYSASRELRNKAEKLRRIRLNGYLHDIKALVPVVSEKTKKSDTTRTKILRVSANYIRLSKLFPPGKLLSVNSHIVNSLEFVEAQKGTFFMLSADGRILFISESIAKQIGYTQLDLLGMYLHEYVHPSDGHKLQANLRRDTQGDEADGQSSPSVLAIDGSPEASTSSAASPASGEATKAAQKSFYLRMKEKPSNRTDRPRYEHMFLIGHYRKSTEAEKNLSKDLRYVFVGVMKPVKDKLISELNLTEAIQDQYVTRHLPDGRIIFSDQRICTVAGYMPSEVQGKSAFNYMLGEDLPWTTIALRTMFANPKGVGLVTYRLKTRDGGLICLQSRGYLELDKETRKIDHFVCINTRIPDSKEEEILEEQRERFTPYIAELQKSSSNDLPSIKMESNLFQDVTLKLKQSRHSVTSIKSSIGHDASLLVPSSQDDFLSFNASSLAAPVKTETGLRTTAVGSQSMPLKFEPKPEPEDLIQQHLAHQPSSHVVHQPSRHVAVRRVEHRSMPGLENVSQYSPPDTLLSTKLMKGHKRKLDMMGGDAEINRNITGVDVSILADMYKMKKSRNACPATITSRPSPIVPVVRSSLPSDDMSMDLDEQDVDFFEILNENSVSAFQNSSSNQVTKSLAPRLDISNSNLSPVEGAVNIQPGLNNKFIGTVSEFGNSGSVQAQNNSSPPFQISDQTKTDSWDQIGQTDLDMILRTEEEYIGEQPTVGFSPSIGSVSVTSQQIQMSSGMVNSPVDTMNNRQMSVIQRVGSSRDADSGMSKDSWETSRSQKSITFPSIR